MTFAWTAVFLNFDNVADSEAGTRIDNRNIIQQARCRCGGGSSINTGTCVIRC